jgi:dephospho-CoA kinase
VLITGISGTGKSSVVSALADRGYLAIDLDDETYSEWVTVSDDSSTPGTPVEPDRDWVWREDRVQSLLTVELGEPLFLSGTSANMGKFLPRFDHIILLSAPEEVIVHRLASRVNNPYGKKPSEAARVISQIETVEPLLRKIADHEIDTCASLDKVVAIVLRLVLP